MGFIIGCLEVSNLNLLMHVCRFIEGGTAC